MSLSPRSVRRAAYAAGSIASIGLLGAGLFTGPGRADTPFEPGSAAASSNAVALVPRAGGLSLGITLGQSLASYTGTVAKSQSRAIDLGTIGLTLTQPGCDGSAPTLKEPPPTLQADSHNPSDAAGQSHAAQSLPSSSPLLARAGDQFVSADPTPKSLARSTSAALSIGPLTIGAADATTESSLINQTRTAVAKATGGGISIANGLVTIDGLAWNATAVSGKTKSVTGTFTVGSIKLSGVPLPVGVDQLASTMNIVNTALAPTGLRLDLPTTSKTETDTGGTVTVSPLAIRLIDSPLGHSILGDPLGTAQPIREQLFGALLKAKCSLASEITVFDVALASVAGGGSTSFEVGGATATTDGTVYSNPFLNGDGGTGGGTGITDPGLGGGSGTGTGGGSGSFDGGSTGSLGSTGSGDTAGGSASAGSGTGGATTLDTTPVAANPTGLLGPHKDRWPAVLAGLMGIVAIAATAGADWTRITRGKRVIPEETPVS